MKAIERLEALHDDLVRRDMYAHARDVIDIITELRPYFAPSDSPFDESAPANSQHFKTWVAVMDALDATGFDWRPRTPQTCAKDAAVAAIRSMAAQCSTQSAQVIPIAWPEPVAREQLDVLQWTIGYFQGCGYVDAAKSIDVTLKWLQKNGCDQIR